MLIDLKLEGKTVTIFGGGIVGERKAIKFLQTNSRVVIISKRFTRSLEQLGQQGKVKLVKSSLNSDPSSISSLISDSDVVIAATDDKRLNKNIAEEAKKQKILMCIVDEPSISDFCLPATTRLGEVRIAICTEGRSPAMAKILRERLEKIITREDILQVELQHYARTLAKSRISDRKSRRTLLYQIIDNPEIKDLLKTGDLEEAKNLAKQIIEHQ